MKKDTPLEREIVKQIIAALRKVPHCTVRKRHGTAYGTAGDPDITGCINGRHFELEVKRPGCKPTELQRQRLKEWAKSGAITGVVTSSREALDVLGVDQRVVIGVADGECVEIVIQAQQAEDRGDYETATALYSKAAEYRAKEAKLLTGKEREAAMQGVNNLHKKVCEMALAAAVSYAENRRRE